MLTRAEVVQEIEPNDRAEYAQPVSGNALVRGQLTPLTAEKQKNHKKNAAKTDADWYRLPATQPGQLVQLDLREGPACARLELYDDTGKTLISQARTLAGSRPVLPSLGREAHASLVKVLCEGTGSEAGGPYQLAIFTRAAKPDEEQEPNSVVRPQTQVLTREQPLQGTLAPENDSDLFLLDFGEGTEVMVLGVTPLPGVAMELTLLDPVTLQPILTRKGARDQGLMVPNLSPQRLPKRALVQLRALAGQAPDQPYVLSLTPLLPTGCARQGECVDRLPLEREPNDTRLTAQPVQIGGAMTGFLDAPSDCDMLELTCEAGKNPQNQVVTLTLTPPPGGQMQVTVGNGPEALTVHNEEGKPLQLGGLTVENGKLQVTVGGRSDGKEGLRPNALWRLETQLLNEPNFELEAGDETRMPGLWMPAHAMVALPPGPQMPHGGWERAGALVPAGDVDAYGLDLRARTGMQGLELRCAGDGLPGLSCKLLDSKGAEWIHLAAGEPTRANVAPLTVPPGQYRVVVTADPPRLSPQPYHVVLREAPEVALLAQNPPMAPTPTSP